MRRYYLSGKEITEAEAKEIEASNQEILRDGTIEELLKVRHITIKEVLDVEQKEVFCIYDFVEDGNKYWSEGCYYEFIGMEGEDYLIRTNFNGVGRVYAEDFDDYFKFI